jgi:stress response protein YsnF
MPKRSDDLPEGPVTVPVIAESADLSKRPVVRGVVHVSKTTETVEEVLRPELMAEEVEVERVPVNKRIKTAPKVRQRGDTTIIPVVVEEIVVTKTLVLKEEIHVRKRQTIEPEEHVVALRKEKIAIERTEPEQS